MLRAFCALLLLSSAAPAFEDRWLIPECRDDLSKESCVAKLRYSENKCSAERPCTKLVVYFTGGLMSCDDETVTTSVLRAYAEDSFVAVAACPFESLKASNTPSWKHAPRVDLLLKMIRSHPRVKAAWSGEHFLLAGFSQGATSPVVTIARTALEEAPHWRGEKTTAACFLDGVYDVFALNEFLVSDPTCRRLRQTTLCERYGEDDCPEKLPADHPDLLEDSILETPPAAFGIGNWSMVECGSKLPRPLCRLNGDAIPAGPILARCASLPSCEAVSLPKVSHRECPSPKHGTLQCREWFNGLAKKKSGGDP